MKVLVTMLSLCLVLVAAAQKTTRGRLKLRDDAKIHRVEKINDTIVPAKDEIGLYGYEKAQQSAIESFFVTNLTDREIVSMAVTISYFNMRGERLHSRSEMVRCDLPPQETRKIDIKTWDRQRLWYYVGSHARHTDFSNPYEVRFHIDYVLSPVM